jgi:hypothetical protein
MHYKCQKQGWCSKVAQSSFFSKIKTQLISSYGGQKTTKSDYIIFKKIDAFITLKIIVKNVHIL